MSNLPRNELFMTVNNTEIDCDQKVRLIMVYYSSNIYMFTTAAIKSCSLNGGSEYPGLNKQFPAI